MLDPAANLLSSSPTNSSISSSDLDTESTGSFFHDRSTTLGTLMGVNFRSPSQRRRHQAAPSAAARRAAEVLAAVSEQQRRRRRWWPPCGEDCDDVAGRNRSSLREFLEVERRFGDVALFGGFEGVRGTQEGLIIGGFERVTGTQEGVLFAEGRVLPPVRREEPLENGRIFRFPESIIGICSCGSG